MKACFLLQRRFAYIGNELAALMQERHGISEFCGYVFTHESLDFLKRQNKVSYSSLLLDEEIHARYKNEKLDQDFLKQLEKDYGLPTLWSYIEADRIVRHGLLVREYPHHTPPYSHEDMLRIVQVQAKAIIGFLKKEKPDFLVYIAIGAIGSMLLYHIAKKKGIKTLAILPARMESIHVVTEHYSLFTHATAPQTLTEDDRKKARAFLDSFRKNPTPYTAIDTLQEKNPSRARHFKFLGPALFTTIGWFFRMWFAYFNNPHRDDYTTIKPWYFLLDRIKRKFRILRGYNRFYDNLVEGEKYVFFPLQLEPEMTTMLYAPHYSDQLWVARQIAKSLPVGYKLYVKEHLAMFGYRPHAFYEELKKIPNVRLIRPTIKSFPLIKNAELITTITSTVGWEAIALGKPVITFGDIFYNQLPFVKKCDSIPELPHLVREQLENFKPDEKVLEDFIASIYHEGVNVDLVDIWEREASSRVEERRNELAPLVDLLVQKATRNVS